MVSDTGLVVSDTGFASTQDGFFRHPGRPWKSASTEASIPDIERHSLNVITFKPVS
jgi:hypothetical protein